MMPHLTRLSTTLLALACTLLAACSDFLAPTAAEQDGPWQTRIGADGHTYLHVSIGISTDGSQNTASVAGGSTASSAPASSAATRAEESPFALENGLPEEYKVENAVIVFFQPTATAITNDFAPNNIEDLKAMPMTFAVQADEAIPGDDTNHSGNTIPLTYGTTAAYSKVIEFGPEVKKTHRQQKPPLRPGPAQLGRHRQHRPHENHPQHRRILKSEGHHLRHLLRENAQTRRHRFFHHGQRPHGAP